MSKPKPPLLLPGEGQGLVVTRIPPDQPDGERYIPYIRDHGRAEDVEKGSALDYWRLLARQKGLLLGLAAAGALAGFLISLLQSPVYRARTTIEVQELNEGLTNTKLANQGDDSSPLSGGADVQTEIQILQSQRLIERTLNELRIASLTDLNPVTVKTAGWRLPHTPVTRDQLIEAAGRSLKVAETGQTRILEITFQSTDPKIASAFANTLTSEFIDQNIEGRLQTNQRTSTWLTQQLDELRANLRRSDDELQAYARKEGLIYTGDKENISTDKLRQLQSAVSQAQADRVAKESRFNIASTAAPDTLPDVLSDNSLRALKANITDLQRQEADLAVTFKPDYSKVKRLQAEVETLEAAFEHERTAVVTRITNDYQESEHREGLLAAAYESQVRLVMADSQKAIQYDILKREVDSNRQIYESMLQRVKESGIASALKPNNVFVIDAARTPEKPYSPNLPVNSVIGLMGGTMLGVLIIVTRQRADRSLQQPGDAGRLLGVPELGVIPRGERAMWARKADAPTTLTIMPRERGRAPADSLKTAAWQDRASGLADSFRAILVSIFFSRGEGTRSVLVITSAGPNEGKTTTATNLAIALARIGQKVLLIDGDIRKPCVHKIFGLENNAGVTNLLAQESSDYASADASIRETDEPNLRVLTSGPAIMTGCDLLFSSSMPKVIAHFRGQFDTIIIDTPPLLHMPDARVLGRMADAVVLVARAGRTLREAALMASARLEQDSTPVLGVILNDWNPKSSPDTFYGNYTNAVMKKYNSPSQL